MTELVLSDLRLVRLSLDNIGPFRSGIESLYFDGEIGPDENGQSKGRAPSNIYMVLARNGHGKTTILESIHRLLAMLRVKDGEFDREILFAPGARAQLDMRATWTIEGTTQSVLVSIWVGDSEPLIVWSAANLDEIAQASAWARIGFEYADRRVRALASGSNELGRLLYQHVLDGLGKAPTAIYGLSSDLPCVLFFPANRALFAPDGARAVMRPDAWGYQPVFRFETDGPSWGTSVDGLLVWLDWLNDGRLAQLLEYLNKNLFTDGGKSIRPPKREELASYVSTKTGDHLLSELSHGERALLQFFARTICHMTRNTDVPPANSARRG